jgi:hypothetical protein
LACLILNEEHIRALAIAITPRHELRLVLQCCRLSDNNDACRNAFVQWLQSDGGPTELDDCHIDSRVIADSLKSNSRLSILRLPSTHSLMSLDPERVYYPNMALILSDLAENRGLTTFDEGEHFIGDENWNILCQSLQRHPTLTRVDLTETGWMRLGERNTLLSDEQKTNRTRAFAEMMQTNTILCAILLSAEERDEDIYTESIQPRLEANLYRPRVLAVKKEADDRPFRQKVLGRALSCVRSNPNIVWMFLSENVDAVVRSEEQEGTSNSEGAVVVGRWQYLTQ